MSAGSKTVSSASASRTGESRFERLEVTAPGGCSFVFHTMNQTDTILFQSLMELGRVRYVDFLPGACELMEAATELCRSRSEYPDSIRFVDVITTHADDLAELLLRYASDKYGVTPPAHWKPFMLGSFFELGPIRVVRVGQGGNPFGEDISITAAIDYSDLVRTSPVDYEVMTPSRHMVWFSNDRTGKLERFFSGC